MSAQEELETGIRELTRPLNGQLPRPWMTDITKPESARVFIVGKNQAKSYSVDANLDQERHINALYNRNGETCRGLYREITGSAPSPTRSNIEKLVRELESRSVYDVLETNVICYSTSMSALLTLSMHQGGRQRGDEIFQFLIATILPAVLIVHGESTRALLEKVLGASLPAPPTIKSDSVVKVQLANNIYKPLVYVIQSLAPPAFNKWSAWANDYFVRLASDVSIELQKRHSKQSNLQ